MSTDRPTGDPWQTATVKEIRSETRTAKTFHLALAKPALLLAGQYYVVRLTAPDGYTACLLRSYSVASAPNDSWRDRAHCGEARRRRGSRSSSIDEVIVGDELEVRGPIGLWFVWEDKTPAILVGGGSGIVPLIGHAAIGPPVLDSPTCFEWQFPVQNAG